VDRDFCYEMQKRCAIYNLAPNVGGTVDIGQYEYGYITEIAETIVECDNHNRSELLSIRDSLSFEIELLKMKYRNIMVIAEDLHVKNLARKNGELISIDFDCFTMAY
jgi:hypothetical protein